MKWYLVTEVCWNTKFKQKPTVALLYCPSIQNSRYMLHQFLSIIEKIVRLRGAWLRFKSVGRCLCFNHAPADTWAYSLFWICVSWCLPWHLGTCIDNTYDTGDYLCPNICQLFLPNTLSWPILIVISRKLYNITRYQYLINCQKLVLRVKLRFTVHK